jgi:hypothetical protein
LGAALVLAPASQSQQHRSLILTTESVAECHLTPARSAAAPLVADNALAPCLPFFELLASAQARTVSLALGRQMALNVQVN